MYAVEHLQNGIRDNDASRVSLLIKLGAPVEADINYIPRLFGKPIKCKPLHWAAEKGHLEVAKLLLTRGAEVDAKDTDGWTPLQRAAGNDRPAADIILLERWCGTDARTIKGMTSLHYAAEGSRLAVAKLLLTNGAGVDVKDTVGWTPLHYAAIAHSPALAKLLLTNGADPSLKDDRYGQTSISYWPKLAEIVKKLEAEKAGKKQPAQPKVETP